MRTIVKDDYSTNFKQASGKEKIQENILKSMGSINIDKVILMFLIQQIWQDESREIFMKHKALI